jgi:hypothetical protein
MVLASRTDPQKLIDPTMTASIPMSGQAKGKPASIVTASTQTPKTIIPAEIKNESTVSMIGVRKLESDTPLLRIQPGICSGTQCARFMSGFRVKSGTPSNSGAILIAAGPAKHKRFVPLACERVA